ncbi:MAG: CoA transferase, partial [Pseudomonadota bacterium]
MKRDGGEDQDKAPISATRGPLTGLTIIDLTQTLAGPFASMMLADLGANVIKVEAPSLDSARYFPPQPEGSASAAQGGYGAYFASINRNKRSIILDLKQPAATAVFRRLVADADVVMENFRVGVMDRLGLGYEALAADHPRLVYGALRGFGDPRTGESPYASWPAYDPVAQAMGGIMAITSPQSGGSPTKIGPGVGDIIPALWFAFGITAACWQAQRSGRGQFMDIAMVDGVLAVCERTIYQLSVNGQAPASDGNGHPLLCPFGLFPAADGFVSLGVPQESFWPPLTALMGRPELGDDERYRTNVARLARRHEVEALIGGWTAQHTKAELTALLG